MKQNPKLDLWVYVWGACILYYIWESTWGAPAAEPPECRYQTFHWPAGTETGSYSFFPGYDVPDSTKITGQGCKLNEILEKAQRLAGCEMCGTVGDVIILRHRIPADSQDRNERDRTFEVDADSPR
jgi:hypothetical protein